MLHLAARTDPAWGRWALGGIDEVLLDHAHCEKKAASTALSLIFRYPEQPQLCVPLSELAREELEHFELVVGHLRRRGQEFRRQRPSPYAGRLMTVARKHEPDKLLDTLLCCALIEARSCERMQVLAGALEAAGADTELLGLYRSLLACEARHHQAYVQLAASTGIADDEVLRARLRTVADHEAAVIADAPTIHRLHNG